MTLFQTVITSTRNCIYLTKASGNATLLPLPRNMTPRIWNEKDTSACKAPINFKRRIEPVVFLNFLRLDGFVQYIPGTLTLCKKAF